MVMPPWLRNSMRTGGVKNTDNPFSDIDHIDHKQRVRLYSCLTPLRDCASALVLWFIPKSLY